MPVSNAPFQNALVRLVTSSATVASGLIASGTFAQVLPSPQSFQQSFPPLAPSAPLAPLAPSAAPLPSVIVTASRFSMPSSEAPIGMTVIDSEQIAASTASNLPDLLAQQVGIHVRDNMGSPDRQIDLRGFGVTGDQNTLVLLDGRRLNENELASTRLSAIPLASIERIEILRGAGSVLYGGGATAGTIHIITRAVRPGESIQSTGGLSIGSLDTRELRAMTRSSGERFGFQADVNTLDTANWRVNNALRQRNASGELRAFLDHGFLALRMGAESQYLGLPGARTLDQFKSDPRGTTTPLDHAEREDYRLALAGAWRSHNFDVEAELSRREGTAASDYRQFDYYSERDRRTLAFTPRMRWIWLTDGTRHETVVGLDTESWRYTTRGASSAAMLDNPWVQTAATQVSHALYIQHRASWVHGTTLTVGVRRQRVSDEIGDRITPSLSVAGANWVSATTLALRQPLMWGIEGYARLGRSFRIATVDELTYFFPTDPQQLPSAHLLAPQTSNDHEIGMQWRQTDASLRWSLFRHDLNHEIHFYAPAGSNVNLPPTRRSGLELEGSLHPLRQLELSAGLTRTDASFRGGEVAGVLVSGREVPLVPRVTAKVAAIWSPQETVRLSAAVRHTGRQRYDNDQANQFADMPSYTLVDLKVSQRVGLWVVGLKVGNLLDRRIFDYGILSGEPQSPSVYPQTGRTVLLSLERRF